jgi:predicted DNA-binding protein
MMRNTTLNLPDALVQRAKALATQNGTTMTALVREHLERITGYREAQAQADDPLMAFSEGRMGKEAAIRALGCRDYAQLLIRPGEHNLPFPKLPAYELESMADTFARLMSAQKV